MTKGRKILFSVILVVVLIPVALAIAVQVPAVQTSIARKVLSSVSKEFNGEVTLDKIYYSMPNSVIVKGLLAKDPQGDTAVFIDKVLVNVSIPSLLTDHLSAKRVAVENADVKLSELMGILPADEVKKAPPDSSEKESSGFVSYELSRLLLKNIHVKAGTLSLQERRKPFAIDYANADLTIRELDARDIVYDDDLTLSLNNLSVSEACGLDVDTFSGDITLDEEGVAIADFRYGDADSYLAANSFKLLFDDFGCFSDFCEQVAFDADFLDSRLDFRSLQHYAGLENMNLVLNFDGHVTGPVSSLRSDGFHVASSTKKTDMELKFHLSGLPRAAETMAGLTLKNLRTSMPDIAQIIYEVTGGKFEKSAVSKFAPGESITFNGTLNGLLTDFVAYGKLQTQTMGEIDVDLLLTPDGDGLYLIDGFADTENFNLGGFLTAEAIGHLSCEAQFSALLGRKGEYSLDTLYVSDIEVLGQNYHGISAKGDYSSGFINARMESLDEKLDFAVTAKFDTADDGSMDAEVRISRFNVARDGKIHGIGEINITGATSDTGSDLVLNSALAGLEVNSDLSFESLLEKVKNKDFTGGYTDAAIKIRNFSPVSELLMPDLYIGDGTSLSVELSPDGLGYGILKSELVAVGDNYLKGLLADLSFRDSTLNVIVSADTIQSGEIIGKGTRIDADLIMDDSYSVLARLNESRVDLEGTQWTISAPLVGYSKGLLDLRGLCLGAGDNILTASGVLSANVEDTLNVGISSLDVSLANALIDGNPGLKGLVNGSGSVFGLFGESRGILLDLEAKDMGVGGSALGDFTVRSGWNNELNGFEIFVDNILSGRNPLTVSGNFKPEDKSIDVDVSIDSLDVSILEPFLSSVVSDVSGSLKGKLQVKGPIDRLSVSSKECEFDNLACKLLYTQVPYVINGPFDVDEYGVKLDKLKIKDRYGHEGRVSGGVRYDHFKDIEVDTRIRLSNMHGLNTNAVQGDSFYGNAFASGEVRLGNGPEGLILDMNIVTEPNSTIHIPLSSSGKEQASLLTFIGNEQDIPAFSAYDSLRVLRKVEKDASSSQSAITVNMNIEATPDAEIQLEINKTTGDVLKARGNGQISINAGGVDEVFDIRGGYTVTEGSYKLSMIGIASRDFSINPGGTISFTGDIMQSDMDMTATYRTKASIGTLIADTTSINTRRNVDCGIGIGGKLANPEVTFSIDIPDLDPATKGKVESALNSEDKRMKQLLAVLVSGSFVPDEESGIVNNTSVLYSNVSEIMANQLNNIFRQLEIPLDLGFNYQPTGSGKDIFDVAISTQLFNNRVLINGNFGNRQYMSASQGDLVGDVDVEIKLNQAGQLRLNLFSHSADEYSNYLDQMQRNGAGIVYQEEFDTFRELWRKLFWSKERRLREEEDDESTYEERR